MLQAFANNLVPGWQTPSLHFTRFYTMTVVSFCVGFLFTTVFSLFNQILPTTWLGIKIPERFTYQNSKASARTLLAPHE
jgi:hypothetical protein